MCFLFVPQFQFRDFLLIQSPISSFQVPITQPRSSMEHQRKKKTKREERKEEDPNLDSFSCMPDSILGHILSFLDTKSAIRTSVLSKRFKLVWTLSPCLDFSFSGFRMKNFVTYNPQVISEQGKASLESFESFVNHVLEHREHTDLTMFRLSLHKDVGSAFVENCVVYAAQHKVQHLKIRGYTKRKPVTLSRLLLSSSSLISLNLSNATGYSIELPKSVRLPNLKVFRLKKFEFSDNNYNGELLLGCPSLETLVLSKCSIRPRDKLKNLNVNSSNLKNLEIIYWRNPWKCFDEYTINVNAPGLSFFKFQGHLARVNFKEALPCLDKARIDLCYPTACFVVDVSERKKRSSESFMRMLHQLRNLKFLSLSLKTIEIISAMPDLGERAPSVFDNLRIIKFTAANKLTEMILPIETIMQLLKQVDGKNLILDVSKKLTTKCSRVRSRCKHTSYIDVPANIMYFLLQNSPAAESLIIEIPEEDDL